MSDSERLTIDTSVWIDYRDERQPRHELAQRLFELWRCGEVGIAVASSGIVFDLADEERLRQLEAEGVPKTAQLAYPGVMVPGENALPSAYVEGFRDAWDTVLAGWKTHEGKPPGEHDALHIETHVMEKRDVFITDDRALRAMCRHLRDDHGIKIEAMSLREYLAEQGKRAQG